jgi:hypothetical protein
VDKTAEPQNGYNDDSIKQKLVLKGLLEEIGGKWVGEMLGWPGICGPNRKALDL